MLNELPDFVVNLEWVPRLRPEDLDLVVLLKVTAIDDHLELLSDAGSAMVGRCNKSGSKGKSVSSQVSNIEEHNYILL